MQIMQSQTQFKDIEYSTRKWKLTVGYFPFALDLLELFRHESCQK